MNCRFSFRHMKASQALMDYAEPKVLEKVQKFSTKPIQARITFSVEGQDHIAHCGLVGGDGFNFQVVSNCNDMYGSVDIMVDKLEKQLRRQKEKLKGHKNNLKLASFAVDLGEERDDPDLVPVDAEDIVKYVKAVGS
ncbi:MAG: ribosome-associated translation inhibitor RaiA [Zetaproteobacteria bacterium]|nr:ribosome-associated translation inhibitor RaiA [Zetaproteobacteria bacterium]